MSQGFFTIQVERPVYSYLFIVHFKGSLLLRLGVGKEEEEREEDFVSN